MATQYFSSGVILMDTAAIRKADPSGDLMNINSARKHWHILPDMDRLNEFFKDETYYLDLKWNVYRISVYLDRLFDTAQIVGRSCQGSQGSRSVALSGHIWPPILAKAMVQDSQEIPHLSTGLPRSRGIDWDSYLAVV